MAGRSGRKDGQELGDKTEGQERGTRGVNTKKEQEKETR